MKQLGVDKQRSSGYDEKPITAKGSYAIPEPDEFDAHNLNFVDDLSEKQQAEADENLMQKVYGGIQSFLSKPSQKQSRQSTSSNGFIEESKDDS